MPPFLPNAWFIFPFGSRKLEQFSENEFLGVRMTDLNRLGILHHRSDYRKMVVRGLRSLSARMMIICFIVICVQSIRIFYLVNLPVPCWPRVTSISFLNRS